MRSMSTGVNDSMAGSARGASGSFTEARMINSLISTVTAQILIGWTRVYLNSTVSMTRAGVVALSSEVLHLVG